MKFNLTFSLIQIELDFQYKFALEKEWYFKIGGYVD